MRKPKTPFKRTDCEGMFGTLFLDAREYAIEAKHIKEVVRLPSNLIKVPLSPPCIRGTFDLRGTAITVIDLAMLFEETSTESSHDRVAVLELNGLRIGVLFGRTGNVFKGKRENFSEFDPHTRGPYVSGLFRAPASSELIQVIDVEGLFHHSGVFTDISRNQRTTGQTAAHKRGKSVRYMMFSAEQHRFALPLVEVQEVFQLNTLSPSEFSSSPSCVGTTELRSKTLPLFDLLSLTGEKSGASDLAPNQNKHVVVMHSSSVLFGMLVDSIDDIFVAYEDEIVSFPNSDVTDLDHFRGCVVRSTENVLVFDHHTLLRNNEIIEISKTHGRLSASPLRLRSADEKDAVETRQTYLTFQADSMYAVLLNEVQEIIDLPRTLLKPPGLDHRFLGVHNLRDTQNIAIAEMTTSYPLQENKLDQDRKVLIFDAGKDKAGLVVDSVKSIVSASSRDRFHVEKNSRFPDSIETDELLELEASEGEKNLVPIVELPSILKRIAGVL